MFGVGEGGNKLSGTQAMKTLVPITVVSLIKYITSYYKPSFSVILVIANVKNFKWLMFAFFFFHFLLFQEVTPQLYKNPSTQEASGAHQSLKPSTGASTHCSHYHCCLQLHQQEDAITSGVEWLAQGCSYPCDSPQLSLCHQKNMQISYWFQENYTWVSPSLQFLNFLFAPSCMCTAKILCLSKQCNNLSTDRGCVSCSAVSKVHLKNTLWPWCRFNLSLYTQFSSSLAFLQSCPKKVN